MMRLRWLAFLKCGSCAWMSPQRTAQRSTIARVLKQQAHREEEEHFLQLALAEVVWQILLGIGAQAGDVGVLPWVLLPEGCNALPHVLCDLHAAAQLLYRTP